MRVPAHKRVKVATVKEIPELAALWEAREAQTEKAQEEVDRMTREIGRVMRKEEREKERFWLDVEHALKGKLPPDFSMDTHILEYSGGAIYTFRKDDVEKTDLENFLSRLFEPGSRQPRPPEGIGSHADSVVH